MDTFLPGATIGILGGGQLGRMTALAAARLGYHVHVYCPSADEPAVEVCDNHTKAEFTDEEALARFALSVDVVTLEWENVPVRAVEVIAAHTPVHPGADVLRIAQDRRLEKSFAQVNEIGTAAFEVIHSPSELEAAMQRFQLPAVLKSTRMGYDGKGQVVIKPGMTAQDAWQEMGGEVGLLEAFVDFACEVSVIVARREDGATEVFPVVENIHRNHILAETIAPARIEPIVAEEAQIMARTLADKLGVVGLLAVEMFVLKTPDAQGRRVLMNEIAPRPHNSGHWTIDACACSQYEQLIRAVCGLPLGAPRPHSCAVMTNLIGDEIQRVPALLEQAGACVHLYGKTEVRAGRKMGHVTILQGAWQ